MDSSIPIQIAETIQTASINRAPSPSHDLNPSTAASQKQPVSISPNALTSDASLDKFAYGGDDEFDEEEDQEDIPYSVITPVQRRASFPPLPDLRFEQSYLQSISNCDTMWKVAYITMRDQVRGLNKECITSAKNVRSFSPFCRVWSGLLHSMDGVTGIEVLRRVETPSV